MNVSPVSGSVVLKVPTVVPDGWFSATELVLRAMSVGALLVGAAAVKDQLPSAVKALPATSLTPTALPTIVAV